MASKSADSARIAATKKAEAKITASKKKIGSGRGAATPADYKRLAELNPRIAARIKAEAKITADMNKKKAAKKAAAAKPAAKPKTTAPKVRGGSGIRGPLGGFGGGGAGGPFGKMD